MFSVAVILLLVLPPVGQSRANDLSPVGAAVSAASSSDAEQSGWGQPLLQQIAGDVHHPYEFGEQDAISLSVDSCCADKAIAPYSLSLYSGRGLGRGVLRAGFAPSSGSEEPSPPPSPCVQGEGVAACSNPGYAASVHPLYLALAEPTTKPATATPLANPATVAGTIRAEGQPIPADIVVYLEPRDAAAKFAVPAQRARVAQKGAQFSPRLTVVSVGQTVEFVNDEDRAVEHNVFSNSPTAAFDLGLFPQRQSRTVVFDKPGPVVLYCSIHKFMDGVVLVCPTPLFSRVDANGKYRIENVVPGEYALKMWQRRPRFPDQSAAISAKAGQNVQLDLELHRK